MDRSYWEKIAPEYNEEIFDVLQQDKKGLIRAAIQKYSGKNKTVIDAGCAIGKWLPVLAPVFKKVIAADISAGNLKIAARNHPRFGNVDYKRVDMSASHIALPKANVVLCVNAILTDSARKRDLFFKNLSRITRKGGSLVLVVPSLESYFFTRIIQQKWKIDKSLFNESMSAAKGLEKYKNAQQGNLDIDSVATKHYVKEELTILLMKEGFTVNQFEKIEYDWKTEFVNPPKWLKHPQPWDWMCVAMKS